MVLFRSFLLHLSSQSISSVKERRSSFCVLLCFIGRGGQSALRFARLRMEKRHNYVRKVAETAVQMFISNDKVSQNILVF